MKIVIDPGHGGRDPGAVGPTGLKEKDIALQVSLTVAQLLRRADMEVKLTRESDAAVELAARCQVANAWKADYFLSVHCNASVFQAAHGTETYCYKVGGRGEVLAKAVQTELATLGRANRGVKTANFYVLRKTSMPAVLTELAFISNREEEHLLADPAFQQRCALAIAVGIGKTVGVPIATQPSAQPAPSPGPAVATGPSAVIYRVQVGSFAQRENAERLAAELREKGYSTYIVTERRDG